MRIERLTLRTADLGAQRAFYADLLGFPVEEDREAGLTLRVGASLLHFVPGVVAGPYHFAFNVPEDRFAEACAWLQERVTLLADDTGATEFYSENWDAHLAYFHDADGNIAEFTGRHTLPASPGTGFGVLDVPGVSEFGLTVESVPDAVAGLRARFALPVYGQASPTFTALGDEEGLLIVVPVGRGWFPTGEPARPLPFALRAHGGGDVLKLEEP